LLGVTRDLARLDDRDGCGRIVGIVSPRRISRAAARCLGELVQIDGSEHAWFEDAARRARCWLSSMMRRAG